MALQARREIAETACKHKSADETEDEEKDWREEKETQRRPRASGEAL